jgi:hypothetical protein
VETWGERYALNVPYFYLPENLYHASIKSAEIRLDLMKECFDSNLGKYKYVDVLHNNLTNSDLKTGAPRRKEKNKLLCFMTWLSGTMIGKPKSKASKLGIPHTTCTSEDYWKSG